MTAGVAATAIPPQERIQQAAAELRAALEADLLDKVKAGRPAFFEELVVQLMLKMGYGWSATAGETVGRSGDGGIDGVVREDKLGLDEIYLQAKKWNEGTVGRPEIQKFVGALQEQRTRKGVFITTSTFTKEAMAYAERVDAKVVLIDGPRLAKLMVEHGLGVAPDLVVSIPKIDHDFFDEELV